LGTFKTASGIIANRRPLIQLLNKDGSIAVKDYPKTTDDTIFVHGLADNDAPVSFNLRGGKAFKGTPGQDWRIYGEKGEIRLTASGPFLQIGYPDIAIAIHDFASNEVKEIDIGKDTFDGFNLPIRNVARVYEAIAGGDKSILCDFEDAVERHRLIDTLYKANSTKL
jgi:predicted dehydrogenase